MEYESLTIQELRQEKTKVLDVIKSNQRKARNIEKQIKKQLKIESLLTTLVVANMLKRKEL